MRIALSSLVLLLGGCVIQAPPREVIQPTPVAEEAAPPAAVVSVYEEPPLSQPAPIAVGWAPPPMLVEVPPPPPFPYSVWVGGYWVWQGNWVWAHAHWMAPPRPQYVWVHPYYEHRGDAVIFINGHWSAPGVVFVPPAPGLVLAVEPAAVGVIPGPRAMGPEGCFVPAPPGSRRGIIVPAPVGTAPAVMTSAPPVVAVGMRVTTNVTNIHNTNITNVTNVSNVTNVTNVTIVAPSAATANGRGFSSSVPAAPHLAAARPAVVQARAPEPVSKRPVAPYVSAHAAPAPPPPKPHGTVADVHLRPVAARESQPMHAGSAGSAQPEHTAQREERASPARSVQSAPAKAAAAGTPVPRTPDAKTAAAKTPAATTPAAKTPAATTAAAKTAAAKTAPAHPDDGKAHKPDAKKDAQQEARP
jgi:hypothetical protein